MRQVNPQLHLASGEYDLSKQEARQAGKPHCVTYRVIERRLQLKPGALASYRANYLSRKGR